jgi:hypothetical protein
MQYCYRPYRGVRADRQDKAVRSMAIRGVAKALTRQIRATGDRLYNKDDALARDNGWTIETRRGGLARTYRDPRFDRLARCPDCGGTGRDALDLRCGLCAGGGRITLGERPTLARR